MKAAQRTWSSSIRRAIRFASAHSPLRAVRDGYVTTEPYGPIELTAAGRRMASDSRKRHEIVLRFLMALGVSEATAQIDSEGIEHHVSNETLKAMRRYLKQSGGAS